MENKNGMNDKDWEQYLKDNPIDDDFLGAAEEFANHELIKNEPVIAHFIKKTYNTTFMAHDFLKSEGKDRELENLEDVPTTVVMGKYDEPTKFVTMTFFTYDWEKESEEPLRDVVEKLKKHLFRLKNIMIDMDFCIISYPILSDSYEFTHDQMYKYGLESMIFNQEGFLGGAVSKRTESSWYQKQKDMDPIQMQFLLPSGHSTLDYDKVRAAAKRGKNAEARAFASVMKQFSQLPSFASRDSLNDLIHEIKRDKIKVITHTDAFKPELQKNIVNLPFEGFIVTDLQKEENPEELKQTLMALIAQNDVEAEEIDELMEVVNNFFDHSEEEE